MKNFFYYFISILATICIITFSYLYKESYAIDSLNTAPSFKDSFLEVGYKSVNEAINEFENHYQCDVILPKMTPDISFTHQFGRFYNDETFNMNSSLEIKFVNENYKANIYKVEIRPLSNKINYTGDKYILKDGSKGTYFKSSQFNFFSFEKNNLQYLLGIHEGISNENTPNLLTQIADSIK